MRLLLLASFLSGLIIGGLFIYFQDEFTFGLSHEDLAEISHDDLVAILPHGEHAHTQDEPARTHDEPGSMSKNEVAITLSTVCVDVYAEGFVPPENDLDKPALGWNKKGGGWPTPFHVFFHHYEKIAGPLADKWEPYFMAYHNHLKEYRGKEVTLVEIGVQSGGSALMWRWYFGDKFKYVGIDINPETRQFATVPWIDIIIGDGGREEFWTEFKKTYPSADIFLDDGGHTMGQMAMAFKQYYPNIKPEGVWMTEDLHTCYWGNFGGNPNPLVPSKTPNFCEYTKNLIDYIHGYRITKDNGEYHKAVDLELLPFLHSTESIHYYESIIVLKKGTGLSTSPVNVKAGTYTIEYTSKVPYSGLKYDWSKIDAPQGFLDFLKQ